MADGHRYRSHECLEPVGGVVDVRVGLVPLEHRELGVVLERDALVAEVLAQLVHPLEAADDQPLEVELGGDPEVEIAAELVVVRGERPRERAAVERLQDRGLDLDEAVLVERPAHGGDDLRAGDEQLAGLRVADQVELPAAEALLDVLEPGVLLGRRAQGLREHVVAVDPQRELPAPGHEDGAVDPDEIAEVELEQPLHRLRAEDVELGLELEPARAVVEVEESHLSLAAPGVQAPRDPVLHLGVRARLEVRVGRADLRDRGHARVGVRERVDPVRAQPLELGPPDGEEVVGHDGLEAESDLGDLRLARRAVRQRDRDLIALALAHQRTPDRRDVRELLRGLGLGGADDREGLRLAGVVELDAHGVADLDDLVVDLVPADHGGRAELLLEGEDARLEHRLLVLGVVVLGVLGDVPELTGLLDALGDLSAANGGELLELVLELLETFGGEDDVLRHTGPCAAVRGRKGAGV